VWVVSVLYHPTYGALPITQQLYRLHIKNNTENHEFLAEDLNPLCTNEMCLLEFQI